MNKVIRSLPLSLRERPFDFYTAFVLFLVGVYGIVDDNFPERWQQPITSIFVDIISVYLIVASSLVIVSLFCKKQKTPVCKYMLELLGWALICAASVAASLLYVQFAVFFTGLSIVWAIWFLIWVGMAVSSFIRAYDLYSITRRHR